jgi:tRNA U38,U39,U40 pseudouridine synthase TruA
VDEELEKSLHRLGMISDFNFGDLKKIGFGRATRTDKRVHALLNSFSCKILVDDPRRNTENQEQA